MATLAVGAVGAPGARYAIAAIVRAIAVSAIGEVGEPAARMTKLQLLHRTQLIPWSARNTRRKSMGSLSLRTAAAVVAIYVTILVRAAGPPVLDDLLR